MLLGFPCCAGDGNVWDRRGSGINKDEEKRRKEGHRVLGVSGRYASVVARVGESYTFILDRVIMKVFLVPRQYILEYRRTKPSVRAQYTLPSGQHCGRKSQNT